MLTSAFKFLDQVLSHSPEGRERQDAGEATGAKSDERNCERRYHPGPTQDKVAQ